MILWHLLDFVSSPSVWAARHIIENITLFNINIYIIFFMSNTKVQNNEQKVEIFYETNTIYFMFTLNKNEITNCI